MVDIKEVKKIRNAYAKNQNLSNKKDYEKNQHITCMATAVAINYLIHQLIDDKHSLDKAFRRIDNEISKSIKYLTDLNKWISLPECIQTMEIIAEELNNPNALYEMGYNSYNLGAINSILRTAISALSPKQLLKLSSKLARKFNKYIEYELEEVSSNLIIITARYSLEHLKPYNRCEYEEAIYSGIPTVFGYKPWRVEQDKCLRRGDGYCRYKIYTALKKDNNVKTPILRKIRDIPKQLSIRFARQTGVLEEVLNEAEENYSDLNIALHEANERAVKEERVNSRLIKFVSSRTIEQCVYNDRDPNLNQVDKYISILFTDIRDFTSISEKISNDDLSGLLKRYFESMSTQIDEKKGWIDKFIGDAIMALFDSPHMAVLSAIEMHKSLKSLNRERARQNYFGKEKIGNLKAGIGIESGDVKIGNVGSLLRMNYSVIGDPVNLASRLEGLTKNYGIPIIIGENTYKFISDNNLMFSPDRIPNIDDFQYNPKKLMELKKICDDMLSQGLIFTRELDTVIPKGKTKKVKIYEVLNSYASDVLTANILTLSQYNGAMNDYYCNSIDVSFLTENELFKASTIREINNSLNNAYESFEQIDKAYVRSFSNFYELGFSNSNRTKLSPRETGDKICKKKKDDIKELINAINEKSNNTIINDWINGKKFKSK